MENTAKRFTVTSALPYANGPVHIGHIAGAYLTADIFVRSQRLQGNEVLYVCGSDEHGAAITMRARKEGVQPKAIVDKYHEMMKDAFEGLGIEFDIYHRTSSELHHQTASDFFLKLDQNDAFEVRKSQQYFDVEAQQFLADRYIVGTCPKCGHTEAYGDQCENCSSALSPIDLIDPRSNLSGAKPEMRETSHWYLPMNDHQDWLEKWINEGVLNDKKQHDPKTWKTQVLGQCNSWLKEGLKPRAMTRDLEWGVKVPLEGADGKVLYVWLDAPIGYISATKQWAKDNNSDWEKWWKGDESQLVHFIGKDNIVFHCIIFPILLKAHGDYNLPVNVPANEFLNLEGKKISTSRNWAVWLHEYLERWPGRRDELRYVLCSLLPESRDSEFTWTEFQERINNELVAVLGNFVNRVMVLCYKYFDGIVPASSVADSAEEQEMLDLVAQMPAQVVDEIARYRFRDALHSAMKIARIGNKYMTESEPWKLHKTAPEKAVNVLANCLNIMSTLQMVIAPFLPDASKRMAAMLGQENGRWMADGMLHGPKPGDQLGKAELLFKKVEDDEIEKEKEILKEMSVEPVTQESDTEEIAFDDFQKMDLRVGVIKSAVKVEKADKLLHLQVDIGTEVRSVVSGIAKHYDPENLAGTQVLLLCNLAPRKIRGVMSQGMILMAENEEGELCFMSPQKDMPAGSEVR